MLLDLSPASSDPLWALKSAFDVDPRPHKIDLGVGVYRDERGQTPVLEAVRIVEARLSRDAPSKIYRPLSGNAAFNSAITGLVLGSSSRALSRAVTVQTVGGTGALRMLGELIAAASPSATIWLSNPGYHNYKPLMRAAGLQFREYPWLAVNGVVDHEPMLAALADVKSGDVLLVQGCCHNPTGVDITLEGWRALASFCRTRAIVPLVDMAYQGLGEGLEEDAAGVRILTDELDTILIAASCSKNMGLYCERTGAAIVVAPALSAVAPTRSVLEAIGRRTYSMAPEHGAAIAVALLDEPTVWAGELDRMRWRIRGVRAALAEALGKLGAPDELKDMRRHRGMFSVLPFDTRKMGQLRDDHAIYGTPEGRINIAGLGDDRISDVASALASVC